MITDVRQAAQMAVSHSVNAKEIPFHHESEASGIAKMVFQLMLPEIIDVRECTLNLYRVRHISFSRLED